MTKCRILQAYKKMSATTLRSGSRLATTTLAASLFIAACGASGGNDAERGLNASEVRGRAAMEPSGEGASAAAGIQERRPAAGTAWIIFGADTVTAEVARSESERAQGLMHRESLGEDAGMIFVFPDNALRSFWMQNTYLPLDIAFMDPSFRILDIQQMEPMTTNPHDSRAPAMFALEVNQGWFEAHGVSVGDTPKVVFGN
jgi:uncharacterized membrane protein (UPF0127 family)